LYTNEYDLQYGVQGVNTSTNKTLTTYTRDAAGRITNTNTVYESGIPVPARQREHLTINQPVTYLLNGDVASDPQGIYTYDARGLVHTRVVAAGTYTYAYDVLGRNSELTYPDGHTRTQAYDAQGSDDVALLHVLERPWHAVLRRIV
jgi:YD repeat-containing protein